MNEQNTNTKIYLNFVKNLCIDLKKENNRSYVIILDNLKLHKTKEYHIIPYFFNYFHFFR